MTNGPSNQNLAEPWQPESSRAKFGLRALPECELGHSHRRGLMTCLSLQKSYSICPPHHGHRHILKSKDLTHSSKSLYHLYKTMGPSGMFGLCITPVAAQVSFVLYHAGAVLANTALSVYCVNSLRLHSSPVKSGYFNFLCWLLLLLLLLSPSPASSLLRLLLVNFTTWFENLHLPL